MIKRGILFSFLITLGVLYTYSTNPLSTQNINQEAIGIDKDEWKFDSLLLDTKVHIDRDESKEGMFVSIKYAYPISAPSYIDLQKLEYTFLQILSGEENPARIPSEAFDNIKIEYINQALEYGKEWEKDREEYPSFINFSNYSLDKANSIDFISRYVIATSTSQYSYLGGAHGAYYISYYNIDLRDYQVIQENELFKANYEQPLSTLIQREVERRNSSPNEDEHIMLLVEISDIKANQNFYFSKEGLVYVYNQYEISPYVQGVVEITIPYDQIKPLLNDRFLEMVDNIE